MAPLTSQSRFWRCFVPRRTCSCCAPLVGRVGYEQTIQCNQALSFVTDGNEVSGAYIAAMENEHRPSVLCLTRQNLPHLEGSSIEASLKVGGV